MCHNRPTPKALEKQNKDNQVFQRLNTAPFSPPSISSSPPTGPLPLSLYILLYSLCLSPTFPLLSLFLCSFLFPMYSLHLPITTMPLTFTKDLSRKEGKALVQSDMINKPQGFSSSEGARRVVLVCSSCVSS